MFTHAHTAIKRLVILKNVSVVKYEIKPAVFSVSLLRLFPSETRHENFIAYFTPSSTFIHCSRKYRDFQANLARGQFWNCYKYDSEKNVT